MGGSKGSSVSLKNDEGLGLFCCAFASLPLPVFKTLSAAESCRCCWLCPSRFRLIIWHNSDNCLLLSLIYSIGLQGVMKSPMGKKKVFIQLVWGILLVLAGIGVFFRIPAVMTRIESIEQFTPSAFIIRICFYVLGILLIGGGSKKIFDHFQKV